MRFYLRHGDNESGSKCVGEGIKIDKWVEGTANIYGAQCTSTAGAAQRDANQHVSQVFPITILVL